MRAQVAYPDRTIKKGGQEFQVIGFWSQADEVGLNQSHDPQRRHRIMRQLVESMTALSNSLGFRVLGFMA